MAVPYDLRVWATCGVRSWGHGVEFPDLMLSKPVVSGWAVSTVLASKSVQ